MLTDSDYVELRSLSAATLLARSAVTGGYLSRPDTTNPARPQLMTREWTRLQAPDRASLGVRADGVSQTRPANGGRPAARLARDAVQDVRHAESQAAGGKTEPDLLCIRSGLPAPYDGDGRLPQMARRRTFADYGRVNHGERDIPLKLI